MTYHSITPPLELLKSWEDRHFDEEENVDVLLIEAYQAGADQELDACCELMDRDFMAGPSDLRAARRPKPPSLKEQALDVLQRISKDKYPCNYQEDSDWDTIRRALDALPE